MNDEWVKFWINWAIGFMGGLFLTMILCLPFRTAYFNQQDLIEECEKDLLRTQYCEMIAVPNEETQTRKMK